MSVLAIDPTGRENDNGNHPFICAISTTKPRTDDKENNGKQSLGTYMQFKGRGRYKLAKCVQHCRPRVSTLLSVHYRSKSNAINAEFEINPDANDGLNYAYDAVVRNKDERRKMHGSDCECCKEVSFLFAA